MADLVLPFDIDTEFDPVSMLTRSTIGLAVPANFPANTLDEFIAHARKNPGKLSYGSFGQGTTAHIFGESLNLAAKMDLVHAAYKGAAPLTQDLMGGQISSAWLDAASLAPLLQAGKIKVLAMLNSERLESVKAYPAITESKSLKNFTFNIWTGYFVKKDTPEAIVQVIHKTITESLSDPAVRSGLEANSQLVAKPLSLQAVDKAYADGTAQFRAIAKSINLQPQ